jgi:metallophosphoesterase superfamily enzyme
MIKYIGKCLLIEEKNDLGKKEKILVVGDLHIGYEEVLNLQGVFVGRKMFEEYIEEFERIFDYVMKDGRKIDKIILLGDVKHGFGKNLRQEWDEVLELFDYFLEKRKM